MQAPVTSLTPKVTKKNEAKETGKELKGALEMRSGIAGTGGPGAVKPRPGVRAAALGTFLFRSALKNGLGAYPLQPGRL